MEIIPYISQESIATRVPMLAKKILNTLGNDETIIAFVLLNGGLWFASDLLRYLPSNYRLESFRVTSYGEGTSSSGAVHWEQNMPAFAGKKVLIIDDVLDTGLTMHTIKNKLLENGAADVYTVVAVNKQGQRLVNCEADFHAFTAGNDFLVGYGMDYAGQFRNLPYIGRLSL